MLRCWLNFNVISVSVAADCPEPAVPANGKLVGLQRKNGDTIRFECDLGYKLVGQSYAVCQGGAWNAPTPSCNCKYLMQNRIVTIVLQFGQKKVPVRDIYGMKLVL